MAIKKTGRCIRPVLRRYIKIMRVVIQGECCVKEIAEIVGADRSTVSRYLKVICEEIPEIEATYYKNKNGQGGLGKYYRWVQ